MRRLKTLGVCPPDPVYFSYFHSETSHRSGPYFDYYTLVQAYKEHRKANDLPIPDNYNELIQEQICSQLPPQLCTYERSTDQSWVNLHFTVGDVIDFTKVLLAHAKEGRQYVEQEEAERRAKICASCYLNINVSGCGACRQLVEALTLGDRSTSLDEQLKSCAVCKCFNRCTVHFPIEILETSDTKERQEQYPSFCWKKKSSANYRPENFSKSP
jgi:hypothetical protein